MAAAAAARQLPAGADQAEEAQQRRQPAEGQGHHPQAGQEGHQAREYRHAQRYRPQDRTPWSDLRRLGGPAPSRPGVVWHNILPADRHHLLRRRLRRVGSVMWRWQ
jgi:hypothetical protein